MQFENRKLLQTKKNTENEYQLVSLCIYMPVIFFHWSLLCNHREKKNGLKFQENI